MRAEALLRLSCHQGGRVESRPRQGRPSDTDPVEPTEGLRLSHKEHPQKTAPKWCNCWEPLQLAFFWFPLNNPQKGSKKRPAQRVNMWELPKWRLSLFSTLCHPPKKAPSLQQLARPDLFRRALSSQREVLCHVADLYALLLAEGGAGFANRWGPAPFGGNILWMDEIHHLRRPGMIVALQMPTNIFFSGFKVVQHFVHPQ